MKYFIRTFGCQMNQHDSEFAAALLEKLNYQFTDILDEADLVLVNTCSIRDTAEKKIFGFIDSLILRKRLNPNLIVIVIGCMVSKKEKVDEVLKKRTHINLVLGTRSLDKIPYYLEKLKTEKGPFIDFDLDENIAEGRIHKREDDFRGYLTIMYGCDNFCSYCIVPYVRGREKSRDLQDILNEAQLLVADGVKEITLLGQNVNSYGKGLPDDANFAQLLLKMEKIEGLERIRYMTSHPKDFSDEIIAAIEDSPKVCRHFHLPFQSGSSSILKKMNRHYTKEYYLELMAKIKSKFPNCVLTTDIIVGFPGETQEDFADTVEILNTIKFDLAYTFMYSPRKDTPAANMPEQIQESVKKQRLLTLMDVQNKISLEKNLEMIGKTFTLLGEGKSRNNPQVQSGRTEGNKLVHFEAPKDYTGKILQVEITKANTWSLKGRLL
ncbi:MAG: tRNA (N6-isopentenyl adenosine(37)-C2)-methylthiotransferase MiaB [Clostridiales bacterium]